MRDGLTWWCRSAQHKTCAEHGAGRGIDCACRCHDTDDK